MRAEVIKTGVLDMQVCVPAEWTDEQVNHFADIVWLLLEAIRRKDPEGESLWHR